jgi:hypothetical protein
VRKIKNLGTIFLVSGALEELQGEAAILSISATSTLGSTYALYTSP